MSQAGADLDATDSDGCTPLESCTDESVMLLLTQALEAAEDGGDETDADADADADAGVDADEDADADADDAQDEPGSEHEEEDRTEASGADLDWDSTGGAHANLEGGDDGDKKDKAMATPSSGVETHASSGADGGDGVAIVTAGVPSESPVAMAMGGTELISMDRRIGGVSGSGANREEVMMLELPEDHDRMVRSVAVVVQGWLVTFQFSYGAR